MTIQRNYSSQHYHRNIDLKLVSLKDETTQKTQCKANNKKKPSFRIHTGETHKDINHGRGT